MAFEHLRRALRAAPPTAAERLVLIVLADFANDRGQAWPSIPTLTRRTALSESGVRRALRRLEAGGWIERDERRGRGASNVYRLTTGVARGAPEAECEAAKAGHADRPQNGKPVTVTGETCHHDRSKPVSVTPNPPIGTSQGIHPPPPPPPSPTTARARADEADGGGGGGRGDLIDALLRDLVRVAGRDPDRLTGRQRRTWLGEEARELVAEWIDLGLSPAATLEEAGQVACSRLNAGDHISSPAYFDPAMRRAGPDQCRPQDRHDGLSAVLQFLGVPREIADFWCAAEFAEPEYPPAQELAKGERNEN